MWEIGVVLCKKFGNNFICDRLVISVPSLPNPQCYMYWGEQYCFILFFMLVSLVITCILFLVAFLLSSKEVDFEKVTVYECGFEPYGEAKDVFNIQFFVVGILFMIFDLELAYLFPWVLYLGVISIFSFSIMFFFLILLVIGFIYEWKKGALDWL